jgi:hypothetical protein
MRNVIALSVLAGLLGIQPAAAAPVSVTAPAASDELHQFAGTVASVHGAMLYLRLRNGRTLAVDMRDAIATHRTVLLSAARPIIVRGQLEASGVFRAEAIVRSHTDPRSWPADE